MTYSFIKLIHIISSTFLFGAGAGTAFLIFRAFLQRKQGKITTETLVFALRHAIFVDWFFTLGAGIVQLVTGLSLGMMAGYSFVSGWLFVSIILFVIIFLLWTPAAYLQMRMEKILVRSEETAWSEFMKALKLWIFLGFPAFLLMITVFYLMVFKGFP